MYILVLFFGCLGKSRAECWKTQQEQIACNRQCKQRIEHTMTKHSWKKSLRASPLSKKERPDKSFERATLTKFFLGSKRQGKHEGLTPKWGLLVPFFGIDIDWKGCTLPLDGDLFLPPLTGDRCAHRPEEEVRLQKNWFVEGCMERCAWNGQETQENTQWID